MEYLSVRIDSPEKVIWEGIAISVSSKNSQGPFDILPHHASFITLVEGGPIEIATPSADGSAGGGKKMKFNFDRSILFVRQNQVKIYTNL